MVEQFFASTGMPIEAYTSGAVIAVLLGLLSAVLPCLRAHQLSITDALRKA
jgi:ABC-type lipoprotein release transport system permease subunit